MSTVALQSTHIGSRIKSIALSRNAVPYQWLPQLGNEQDDPGQRVVMAEGVMLGIRLL